MTEHFKILAEIFKKMQTLCNRCAKGGSSLKDKRIQVKAIIMLKENLREIEGFLREMKACLRADIVSSKKKTKKRKTFGKPELKRPKKKAIVFYNHSDFKDLEEYITYMRRSLISDKETEAVDWDKEFENN
jgi:hypothetical protein